MSKATAETRTTLCLVRHGESTWNAQRRIQGQLDPPLSPLGRRQAELVAERLAKEPWSALYASDLKRAYQTAEAIARATGLPVRKERLLREQGQGKREGLLLDDANRLYPDPDAPEVGRETIDALRLRAHTIFTRIRDAHSGERVIVVAHGALMRAFLRSLFDGLDELVIPNTACTLLHWNGDWHLDYLADASHLAPQAC